MTELKAFLNEEVEKLTNNKIKGLKSYGLTDDKEPMYLVEDVMTLLGIKAIWHKISNLISDQEKFSRTITIDGHSRSRTLIIKKGVCKIIASMRTKPHRLICEYFGFKSLDEVVSSIPEIDSAKVREDWIQAHSFEPGPNNIYIKRLQSIFENQHILIFKKVEYEQNKNVIIDVFFPKYGIAILFSKKKSVLDDPAYQAAERYLSQRLIHIKSIAWLQFASYDTNNITQFDELLKNIVNEIVLRCNM